MNIIILLGQRVRSGTNFVGVTLSLHPDVSSIPPNISSGEFNLFRNYSIKDDIFDILTNKSFGSGVHKEDFPIFMEEYGKMWIKMLTDKYDIPKDKTIFIKSPFIAQFDLWQLAFPNSKIGLLCRDGRDNVISSVKAANDKRRWHSTSKSLKKRLNYHSGRLFINSTKDWKKTASVYIKIKESGNVKKFKYEGLNNSATGIKELLEFYNLDASSENVEICRNAPVVGSSFGVDENGMIKPNWKPDYNKEKFKFSGKWHGWNALQKNIFKKIAGKELVDLGYENDSKW